jgi:hypothetical protein
MAVKKVLVGVEESVWGQVKAAAALEGRGVGAVVENALKLYLAGVNGIGTAGSPLSASDPAVPVKPTVTALRELVRSVPGLRATELVYHGAPTYAGVPRAETAREKAMRIAERQAYLKDHPEEDTQ